jgi:WhiB family redox-sensing transcriptional regulator
MTDLSRGACAGLADSSYADQDIFYPEPQRGRPTGDPYEAARAVCAACSIRDICLQDALTEPVQWGYRAGMTPEQRQALRQSKPTVKYAAHPPNLQRMEMYDQGLNDRELGAALGMTHKAIIAWRKRENLPANSPAHLPHTPEQTRTKWAAYEAGQTDAVIAQIVGCTQESIRKWRMRNQLKVNPVRERVSA